MVTQRYFTALPNWLSTGKTKERENKSGWRRNSPALDQPLAPTDVSGAASLFGSGIYKRALGLGSRVYFPLFVGETGLDPQLLGLSYSEFDFLRFLTLPVCETV